MRTLRDHAEELILAEPNPLRREAARHYLDGRQVLPVGRAWTGGRPSVAERLRTRAERSDCVDEMSPLLAAAVEESGGVASPAWLETLEPRLEGLETYGGLVRFLLESPDGREVLRVRDRGRTVFLSVDAVLRCEQQTTRLWYGAPFAEQQRRWVRSLGWEHLLYVMGRYLENRTAQRWLVHGDAPRLHAEMVMCGGWLRVVAPLLRAALRRHGTPLFVPLLELVEPWFDGIASHPWVVDVIADAPWLPPTVGRIERDGLNYLVAAPGTAILNDVVLS
jgi:hypothetical protein